MKSAVSQFETVPLLENSNQNNNMDTLYMMINDDEKTRSMSSSDKYCINAMPLNLDLYTSHIHLKRDSVNKSEENTVDIEKGTLPTSKQDSLELKDQTEKHSFFQKDDIKRVRKET